MEAVLPILLQHPSICEDQQIVCSLLQVRKGLHATFAGLVPLRFVLAPKQQHSSTVAAWIQKHHALVKTLQLDLGPAQPSDAAGPLAAAANSIAATLQQLKRTAPQLQLVSYSTPLETEGTAALVKQLPGSHLTSLTLNVYGPHVPIQPKSLAALAQLQSLRSLNILWAWEYCPTFYSASATEMRQSWTSSIAAVTPHLTQLTRLQVKDNSQRGTATVRCEDVVACLPSTVQELELQFTDDRFADECSSAAEVQAAAGHPLQLGHLTALIRLSCSGLPIAAGDVLPPNLRHLRVWKCFSLPTLLGLQQLQVLGLEASCVKATQLLQLNSMPQLKELRLHYSSSDIEDWAHRLAAADRKAVKVAWTKLPALRELSLQPCNCTRRTMKQLAQLQGLVSLEMDCMNSKFDMCQFAHVVLEQLTGLTNLELFCCDGDGDDQFYIGHRSHLYSRGEVAVMRAVAGLPHLAKLTLSIMAGECQSLLDLSEFHEVFDECNVLTQWF